MLEFVDVKPNIFDEGVLELLKPSVFNPTQDRLKARAEQYAHNPNAHIFACRKGSRFVGIVVFESENSRATVLDIAVAEQMRGRGIGSAMLDLIFKNFNVTILTAETDDDAVGFYLKYGFKIVETKTVYDTKRYVCEARRKLK